MEQQLSVLKNWSYQSRFYILIAKCLLCFVFLFAISNAFATSKKGYIITHDKKHITGQIQDIYYSYRGCHIKFLNDSGDQYTIYPILIKGFSFVEKNGKEIFYESRYHENTWYFLKIIEPGKVATLLKSHHRKKHKNHPFQVQEKETEEFWIELYDDEYKLFRITSLNFKKIMRKNLIAYPALRSKIGSEGYRYINIIKIIKELNDLYEDGLERM